jgi:hypothetical protein
MPRAATIYVLTLRAASDRDAVRDLRTLLKFAGRYLNMRSLSVREVRSTKHPARHRRLARWCEAKQRQETKTMDMSEYAGSRFLKVQDVKGGPIHGKIVRVDLGKYNKPNIHLDDGSILSGNATNVRALCRAYRTDSEGWIDREIELVLGTIEYQGEDQEAIVVNPISPISQPKDTGAAKATKPAKVKLKSADSLDDEITF